MYKTEKVPIFGLRMAAYLMLRGFGLRKVLPNKKEEGLFVYYFRDCPELRQAMRDYRLDISDVNKVFSELRGAAYGEEVDIRTNTE